MSALGMAVQSEAGAVVMQSGADPELGIMSAMMALANVEAGLSACFVTEIERRLYLYDRREELVLRLASLGAQDVLERTYRWAN